MGISYLVISCLDHVLHLNLELERTVNVTIDMNIRKYQPFGLGGLFSWWCPCGCFDGTSVTLSLELVSRLDNGSSTLDEPVRILLN